MRLSKILQWASVSLVCVASTGCMSVFRRPPVYLPMPKGQYLQTVSNSHVTGHVMPASPGEVSYSDRLQRELLCRLDAVDKVFLDKALTQYGSLEPYNWKNSKTGRHYSVVPQGQVELKTGHCCQAYRFSGNVRRFRHGMRLCAIASEDNHWLIVKVR